MKKINFYVLSLFILFSFSCQKEVKKNTVKSEKITKNTYQLIKMDSQIIIPAETQKIIKKNKNLNLLLNSFNKEVYSIDQLKDLVKQNLNYTKSINQSSRDTAAIKSRMLVTEINLKRLNFLLQKKKIQTDTIKKTLNAIVQNLQSVVQQFDIYRNNTNEFDEIMKLDSLPADQKDSILNHIHKSSLQAKSIKQVKKQTPKKAVIKSVKNFKIPKNIRDRIRKKKQS